MQAENILMTSAAVVVCGAVASKLRLLRSIQRAATYARASGFLVGEMYHGAWDRLGRWAECVERARREL